MKAPIQCSATTFKSLSNQLKQAFLLSADSNWKFESDLETSFQALLEANSEIEKKAQICMQHDLLNAVEELSELSPIEATSKWSAIFPWKNRRKNWADLQEELDWTLPKLSIPVIAQYFYGLFLLVGFVLQFIRPLIGLPMFFGGIILLFQLEKIIHAVPYKDVSEVAVAMVAIDKSAIELGVIDNDLLRIVFIEILMKELEIELDPQLPLPTIEISNA